MTARLAPAGSPAQGPARNPVRNPALLRALAARCRPVLLLTPALAVVALTFGAGALSTLAQSLGHQPYLPGSRLGLDAYRALWTDPAVRASLGITLRVAVVSTTVATVLGVATALLLRRVTRGRAALTSVLTANLAVPHLVGAVSMLLLLSDTGLVSRVGRAVGLWPDPRSFPALVGDSFGWGIIAEYVWKETPFLCLVALVALSRDVAALEDAARTLGATRWQRLWHVTLPVIAPTVLAGSVLVLAFAAGSYEVPLLLGRPFPATLPVVSYQHFRDTDLSQRPTAMAVAVVIAVLGAAAVAAYLRLTARLSRERA
ncbi:MAG: ABC transporter permease subunit [Nocardioidaceae bacterium]